MRPWTLNIIEEGMGSMQHLPLGMLDEVTHDVVIRSMANNAQY